jgi:hypothetical protein
MALPEHCNHNPHGPNMSIPPVSNNGAIVTNDAVARPSESSRAAFESYREGLPGMEPLRVSDHETGTIEWQDFEKVCSAPARC